LPPLSGFVGKVVLLTAALNPSAMTAEANAIPLAAWALLAILLVSGLATLIAMTRAGIHIFWAPVDRAVPRIRIIEMAPVLTLIAVSVVLTSQAGPVMRYMHDTAQSLHAPRGYIRNVLPPAPPEKSSGADRT